MLGIAEDADRVIALIAEISRYEARELPRRHRLRPAAEIVMDPCSPLSSRSSSPFRCSPSSPSSWRSARASGSSGSNSVLPGSKPGLRRSGLRRPCSLRRRLRASPAPAARPAKAPTRRRLSAGARDACHLLPRPSSQRPKISLEERFGTQWVVWAGGIALALGGFFLVRQAIEQGWFGPVVQVLLGAAVALALIAAGEWTRRHEILTGVTGLPKAHIPSVLTAAGTAIAYADVLCGLRGLRLDRSGRRLRPARRRGARSRSPRRCCMVRRSPGSAWSARSSRR